MPKPTFHKRKRPDRMTAPDLAARKSAFVIDELLKPVTARKSRADQKWGMDRLAELVPTDWAMAFGMAVEMLEQSLLAEEPDPKLVAEKADNLIRAYDALDKIADDSGAERPPEMTWHMQVNGRSAILALDRASMHEAMQRRPDALIYTVEEIERLLELRSMDLVNKAKEVFPGAEVIAVKEPTPLERELEDEIPF